MNLNHAFASRLLQRPIAFHRVFADVSDGRLSTALFLSQLYYWSDKGRDSEGWIYKTFDEWQEEIGINKNQWETARKELKRKGFLEEKRKGLDPRLHYRLSLENLYQAINTLAEKPEKPEKPEKAASNLDISVPMKSEIGTYDSDISLPMKSEIGTYDSDISLPMKSEIGTYDFSDASYIQRIHTENTYRESQEGARTRLYDSEIFEPENPETATDRGQDSGIEPLRKAELIKNPEPETAFKDCPEPDIDQDAAIFRNSEINPSYRATTNNQPSSRNPDIEKTNIPPAAPKISGVEAASPPAQVVEAIDPNSSGLTARFSQEEQESLINQAIATYNQHRGRWGYCPFLSNTSRSQLFKLLLQIPGDRVTKSLEFIALVRDATLWCAKSDWLNRPDFENKHFSYLIGRNGEGDRILDYASKWRSLPEEAMVGAALKITQSAGEKTYCHPDGTPTELAWARLDWKDISKRAKAGEPVSQAEKDWANYYFPQFDIYLEHEEI
jgi:hypothetical protein